MGANNYKLTIAYDGTNYSGWQIQPNSTSIQELIQNAVRTFLRQDVIIIGSGRTDAGVHAVGQVAHFKCDSEIDLFRFFGSLNGMLPRDIRVLSVEKAPLDFHAQRSAISKTYHYNLYLDRVQSPFKRLYSWHIHEKCDLILLKEAASYFIGKHNFSSFANEASEGCASRNPVRTIQQLDVVVDTHDLCLVFSADGFLYKMVRNIVGTLIEVSTGKRSIEEIPIIFKAEDRKSAGQAAPPHGLFLMHVDYASLS